MVSENPSQSRAPVRAPFHAPVIPSADMTALIPAAAINVDTKVRMYDWVIPCAFSDLHSSGFNPLSRIHGLPKPFGEYQKAPITILAIAERIIAHTLNVIILLDLVAKYLVMILALFVEKEKAPRLSQKARGTGCLFTLGNYWSGHPDHTECLPLYELVSEVGGLLRAGRMWRVAKKCARLTHH